MKTCRLPPAVILACLSIPASANAADLAPGETIIVTATRTEIPLEDAIVPVTVITREEIELSLANDLAELLRLEAGIDIGRNGGPGQATSIFMRGTESNHTLVLVDGVRMNPGTLGGAAIQHISPAIIERVEIVKGARSALFGTDAIGGVINIITRRAQDAYVEASAGTGSFDSRSGYVSGGTKSDRGEFGVTLNWQATDGYAPRTDSDIERGYENLSANVYASRRFGDSDVSFRHWRTGGNVEYLDFFLNPVDQDFENSTTALELSSKLADHGSSKLVLSYMEDSITQNQADDFVESDRVSIDWQYSHAFKQHTLTGGLFGIGESASTLSFGSGFEEDTVVRAVFLQDQWSRDRHRTFVALRFTDHETFGNHTTWNAEYAFAINDDWTINAGLAHAFRAPDATDRFGFGGNPDLAPELADEVQLGLHYKSGSRHRFDFELYRNDIEDLIEFNLLTFELENIADFCRRTFAIHKLRHGPAHTIIPQNADLHIALFGINESAARTEPKRDARRQLDLSVREQGSNRNPHGTPLYLTFTAKKRATESFDAGIGRRLLSLAFGQDVSLRALQNGIGGLVRACAAKRT